MQFDLLVVGAGSGGVRAARIAAQLGARVAIIEGRFYGGTCVNVGCVPKKLFSYAAQFSHEVDAAAGFGWKLAGPIELDWAILRDNKTREIERLNGVYERLLDAAGVVRIWGHGRFVNAHELEVDGQRYFGKQVLIATGSTIFTPDVPGIEYAIVSDDIFYLPQLPKTLVITGGGYIALEFASIMRGLGVQVHLVYRGEKFLRAFDDDLRDFMMAAFERQGIICHFQRTITQVMLEGEQRLVELDDGSVILCDQVLFALGRDPNVAGLGLDKAGVIHQANGAIDVNDCYQTNVPHIYAVGDVLGGVQLTPLALEQGMFVARNLFAENKPASLNEDLIATAVFTHPNLATVGLTEGQAIAQGYAVDIFSSDFKPLKYTLTGLSERSLMKVVVDKSSDRVLGIHMAGDEAAEIMQGFAVAMLLGVTKAQLDATIGIHPTAAEEFVTMR